MCKCGDIEQGTTRDQVAPINSVAGDLRSGYLCSTTPIANNSKARRWWATGMTVSLALMACCAIYRAQAMTSSSITNSGPPLQLLELQQQLELQSAVDGRRELRAALKIGIADDASISPGYREQLIGAKFQTVVKYQSVTGLPGQYKYLVKPYLDAGKSVVLVTEFIDGSYANLQAIGDGSFDWALNKFIDDWKADGNRQVWIRPMHEFNGDWYSWGTYRNGNSQALFKRAFQHVAYVFKNRGANAKFQLGYNCVNPRNDGTSFSNWWPGGDVVDMILCSGYNRAGLDSSHQSWQSFSDVYSSGYYKMAALDGGKPLGVAETSSTTWQSYSKPQWIKDAFDALVNKFTRVEQCNWFLINKDGNWGLNSDDERHAFGDSINQYSWAVHNRDLEGGAAPAETAVTAVTAETAATAAPTAAPLTKVVPFAAAP